MKRICLFFSLVLTLFVVSGQTRAGDKLTPYGEQSQLMAGVSVDEIAQTIAFEAHSVIQVNALPDSVHYELLRCNYTDQSVEANTIEANTINYESYTAERIERYRPDKARFTTMNYSVRNATIGSQSFHGNTLKIDSELDC